MASLLNICHTLIFSYSRYLLILNRKYGRLICLREDILDFFHFSIFFRIVDSMNTALSLMIYWFILIYRTLLVLFIRHRFFILNSQSLSLLFILLYWVINFPLVLFFILLFITICWIINYLFEFLGNFVDFIYLSSWNPKGIILSFFLKNRIYAPHRSILEQSIKNKLRLFIN